MHLADAGYRSEAVMAELAMTQPDTELVTALGREGKVLANPRDAQRYPHRMAMAAKFEAEQGKIDYRKRKWTAGPPNSIVTVRESPSCGSSPKLASSAAWNQSPTF